MKVYISGPITGVKGYMERFRSIEKQLQAEGYIVVNPARVNAALPEETSYEEYMIMSLVMLDMCDTIYMMRGWQQSTGCNMEIQRAMKQGHTIIFEGGRICEKSRCKQM